MEHNPRSNPLERLEGKKQMNIQKPMLNDRRHLEKVQWESQRNIDAPSMDVGGSAISSQIEKYSRQLAIAYSPGTSEEWPGQKQ